MRCDGAPADRVCAVFYEPHQSYIRRRVAGSRRRCATAVNNVCAVGIC